LLKKKGYDIRTERLEVENQFQEKCKVANYVLEFAPVELPLHGRLERSTLAKVVDILRELRGEVAHDNDKAESVDQRRSH
jgi:hypothetical protein